MQEGTKNLLKSSGVDVDSISSQATSASKTIGEASSVAAPTVNKLVGFLSSSSPETLGKIAVVLVAVYYLTPFALKGLVSSFRGYAGENSAACGPDDYTHAFSLAFLTGTIQNGTGRPALTSGLITCALRVLHHVLACGTKIGELQAGESTQQHADQSQQKRNERARGHEEARHQEHVR